MMETFAQPGEGRWFTPTLFHYTVSTIKYKNVRWCRADILSLFLLYSYSLCTLWLLVSTTPEKKYSPSHQYHWYQWRPMGEQLFTCCYMLTSAGEELLTESPKSLMPLKTHEVRNYLHADLRWWGITTESPVSLIPVKTLGVRNNIHYTVHADLCLRGITHRVSSITDAS